VISIIFCASLSISVFAQSYNPLSVKEYRLSNGLTVWLNEDHSQPKVLGAVIVKAGAKDCPNTGIAHYFEHIMFKGTDKIGTTNYIAEKILLDSIAAKYDELALTSDIVKRQSIQKDINNLNIRASVYVIPNEFDRLISRYGGSGLNAGTSYDYTVYYNEFSPQYINQWSEVNSERLLNPVFRLFQSELETVYEEKNMYNDRIGGQAVEKVLERFFAPHPYSYQIIGSTENLKNPKLSDMRKFYQTHYVAGNMGLIMSGDFNTEQLIPVLEKTFVRIPTGNAPKTENIQPKPFNGVENFQIKLPIPVVKILALGWRGVPSNHRDEVALRIVSGLLNNENATGYLDKLAVDGKVLQAEAFAESMNEAGVIGLLVVPKLLFQSYNKAKRLTMHEVERVKNGDFSDEVFNSLKLEQKRNYEKELESIDSRAQKMLSILAEGKSWSEYLNEVKEIEAITKLDVVRVANKYFTNNYLQVTKKTGSYPKDKIEKPNLSPIVPSNIDAKSEYAKNLEKTQTLEAHPRFLDFQNDVKTVQIAPKVILYVTENPVNDIFTLNFAYKKGTLESKLISPASTYVNLLGTDSLTFNQFKTKLQNIGSTLNFSTDENNFNVKVSGFDKHFQTTLALVGNFMKNVKVEPQKMRQLIDDLKITKKAELKSSDDLAAALLAKVSYGNQSEYLNRLSLAEMKKLKGEDLIAEFKSVLKVECDIHYCGNLNSDIIVNQLQSNIQVAEITTPSRAPFYRELQLVNEPIVYFINDSKSSQSIIDAYLVGSSNKDLKSRAAGELFNNYFGGSMSSLVFQQIREFRSLAYRAYANFNLGPYIQRDKAGLFTAKLSTQCDKTIDAMAVLDTLIRQMPAKAERVETARQDLVNEANNKYPSIRNRSSHISNLKNNGFSLDPNIELISNVNNMDIENIVQFYNQNIKGRSIAYIVVGNSKKIDMTKLATFGKVVKVLPTEVFK